jgi:hypothetical protein
MTTLPKQQFRTMYIWMLFVLLSVSACQPASTVFSSTQPTSTQIPIIEPTSTEAVIPLPTFALPTATPVPTKVTSMLTPNGPWLVYLRNYPHPGMADLPDVMAEFGMLNQDGSGLTIIDSSNCREGEVNDFLLNGSDTTSYMAWLADGLYLFRPSEATGILVNQELWFSRCHTFYSGDEKGGFLASIHQTAYDVIPELIMYELPTGKILAQIPLFKCSETDRQCSTFDMSWWEFQWSPNGRYLAFPASLNGQSTDLYVYDSEEDNLRQLTSGPDNVGQIWWSPDGSWIIMGEILGNNYPYTSSVWAVSVSTNEIKQLYSREHPYPQGLLGWLSDRRFITYDGTSLANALDLPAYNLRVVDIDSGETTALFNGSFMAATFNSAHETVVFYAYDQEPAPGYEGPGIYTVSASNLKLHFMPNVRSMPWWDNEVDLFVTEDPCENDPQSLQAFNYQGTFKCIPKSTPTPAPLETTRYSAPNGNWTISAQDGLWLEAEGKPAVRVSQETASDVIWCPDASCFFFSVLQQNHQWTLYHVSLPDLTVKMVDEGIESAGGYQWLGGEK